MTTALAAADFRKLFESFRAGAFRLEVLAHYSIPGEAEAIRLFLDGKPKPAQEDGPWQELIRQHRRAGRLMQRVHVIRGELTDYLRWEIGWGYPYNAAAGEDIRILHVGADDLPELGGEDFWLFDDERVVLMRYGPEGDLIERVPSLDPKVLDACRRKRDAALSLAVPLSAYTVETGT